jgi:hypothetical protein
MQRLKDRPSRCNVCRPERGAESRRCRASSGGLMRSNILVALTSSVALVGCASFQETSITIPSDTLRPEFTAVASTGFDALSEYELRYTIDGLEFVVEQDEIARDGSLLFPKLTYVVPEAVPPGSLVSSTWSARFLSGPQASQVFFQRTPEPLHDLQVTGVFLYVDEKPVTGNLASEHLDGDTDHPLRFVLEEGVPVRVRAVVYNNSGAIVATPVRLHFPDLPHQQQAMEKALGPGDGVVVVFDEVTPKKGKGVLVVDFGEGERTLDTDPSNDAFRTGIEIRG